MTTSPSYFSAPATESVSTRSGTSCGSSSFGVGGSRGHCDGFICVGAVRNDSNLRKVPHSPQV